MLEDLGRCGPRELRNPRRDQGMPRSWPVCQLLEKTERLKKRPPCPKSRSEGGASEGWKNQAANAHLQAREPVV